MKKLLATALALTMALSMTACGGGNNQSSGDGGSDGGTTELSLILRVRHLCRRHQGVPARL